MLRTKSSNSFNITIQGANDSEGTITFANGNDPYGFIRNGKWHRLIIPVNPLVESGLDLSACQNIFTMTGGSTDDIAVDDIFFSLDSVLLSNSLECYPVDLSITPSKTTIKAGRSKTFTAKANNQFGNKADAYVNWFSDGGSIDEDGVFTSEEAGEFTVWAVMNEFSDSSQVTVQKATGVDDINTDVKLNFRKETKEIILSGLETNDRILISDISGRIVLNEISRSFEKIIPLANNSNSVYIIKVYTSKGIANFKLINN